MLMRQLVRSGHCKNPLLPSARRFTTQADVKTSPSSDTAKPPIKPEDALPFKSIPGPTIFQFVRGFMPGGMFQNKSITDMNLAFHKMYGHIFRLPGMFGNPSIIIAMNPDDFPVIFRNEGPYPNRMSFSTMTYFRRVHRKELFEGAEGILTTSGEEWYKIRTAVNPILLQPKNARLYLKTMLEVNDEFMARIREIRDPVSQEMPATFEEEINRLTFESVAAVALNTQVGLIRKNRDDAEAKLLFESLKKVFDLAFKLEFMPSPWRFFKTPNFHKMMAAMDALTNFCVKHIDVALARIDQEAKEGASNTDSGKEKSVLDKLLQIDRKIAVTMALDMMMAGVDTTSTSLTGILLCIAKNPEKQQLLFEEAKRVLPQKDSHPTDESMRNLPYLRACIKEGMRIYPVLPGTMRAAPHDIVLSGYRIPAGTNVAIGNTMLLSQERYVPRASEFLPERWLRSSKKTSSELSGHIDNAFMFLPFGFGPRSCAGKRIVDLELEINLLRLVRNFDIGFDYSVHNAFKTTFINVPNIPLKFKFVDRNE